jgi:hypothetical protein
MRSRTNTGGIEMRGGSIYEVLLYIGTTLYTTKNSYEHGFLADMIDYDEMRLFDKQDVKDLIATLQTYLETGALE